MIAKLFVASIVAGAAFSATAPAHAIVSMNGQLLNGVTNNGATINGVTNNGVTNNGATINGASVDGATVDREDSRGGSQPQPLFSIDGVIVPQ